MMIINTTTSNDNSINSNLVFLKSKNEKKAKQTRSVVETKTILYSDAGVLLLTWLFGT